MTSDFTHLYINDSLGGDLDHIAITRIEAAFPTKDASADTPPNPYITAEEAAADTFHFSQTELDAARQRNIDVARAERLAIIEQVGLLDTIGVMTVLGTRHAVDTARAANELIVIEDHGTWLYPAFQFNPDDLKPYPVIKEINTRLFNKGINRWGELAWWVTKNAHLNGENPAAFLTPQRAEGLAAYIQDMPTV